MTRKTFLIISTLFVLIAGSSAMAGEALFLSTGWGGDGTWTGTGPNWGWGGVAVPIPTASDTAHLMINPAWSINAGAIVNAAGAVVGTVNVGSSVFGAYNGELTITSAGNLAVGTLNVSQSAGKTGTVTNSGTITVASTLQLGSAGVGTVTNSGTMTVGPTNTGLGINLGSSGILNNTGTFTVTGTNVWFMVGYNGYGEINMNGGTLTVPGDIKLGYIEATGSSHVNLNGGTINIAGTLGLPGNGRNTIDITAGILTVGSDITGGLGWPFSVGLITAYGGWGEVEWDYGITNPGKTTVWATNYSPAATGVTWSGEFYTKRWNRVLNWQGATGSYIGKAIPRTIDNASITSLAVEPNSPIIMADEAVVVNDVAIGNDLGTGHAAATLTVNGGTLDCHTLFIGKLWGTDGTVRPAHLQLNSGTVTAVDLDGNPAEASIGIEGGLLILDGDETATIEYLRSTGKLTTSSGCISVDYNVTNALKTTVKVYPTVLPGDLNTDCWVDLDDLVIMAGNWLKNSAN